MPSKKIYDVVIIGAGPIGLACAIEAKKNNLNYVIIEKGCVVNSIFHFPTNMTFFSTSEKIEIGGVPFVSHDVKPTRREALDYYSRVAGAYELNIHTDERVLELNGKYPKFNVITSLRSYTTKTIIIAIGFYDNPNLLNVPGEELPKVKHYFDEAHPYAYKDVAVIGGGNSAVDVALETFRKNANVTLIVREADIKPSVKYWVRPDIENRIKEGSIKSFFHTKVLEITPKFLVLEQKLPKQKAKIFKIKNDYTFSMTGYHPNFSLLTCIGINVKNGKPKMDKYFQSNVKGVYTAGVVCGGMETDKFFIENSRDHASRIFTSLIKQLKKK
ncbi:MAG TPA: YpdA family putative bacillithiol disulfide reductase [Ignavibacteria bacterium]|nr:YpdA family putative bacillithiol disulfide reductase [Ignavibacteria bacterium]